MKFFQQLFKPIGLDLGSSRTRIWVADQGIVVDEPTCIAVDERSQKVLAVGQDALDLSGRVAKHVTIYHPVQKGVIEYPEVVVAFLRVMLQRVIRTSYFFRPVMMVSIPAELDTYAQQTVVDVLHQAGAREVFTITQPLAAAIGAGVPIADASGSFVLQLGGGLVEGGIISLGSLVATECDWKAGQQLDHAIRTQVQTAVGLDISPEEAKLLKHTVATLLDRTNTKLVTGQDLAESVPKEVEVTSEDIYPEIARIADSYVELMKRLLERIPPELTADLIDKGMLLSGGLAQLEGLDQYLVKRLGVSVAVIEDPDTAVIRGVGTALEHLELFKESLGYQFP